MLLDLGRTSGCPLTQLVNHTTFKPVNGRGRLQGFDDKVGLILKQIYPPTMMRDLETSSQDAIIELAQAFPYQPSAGAAGLSRLQQV